MCGGHWLTLEWICTLLNRKIKLGPNSLFINAEKSLKLDKKQTSSRIKRKSWGLMIKQLI